MKRLAARPRRRRCRCCPAPRALRPARRSTAREPVHRRRRHAARSPRRGRQARPRRRPPDRRGALAAPGRDRPPGTCSSTRSGRDARLVRRRPRGARRSSDRRSAAGFRLAGVSQAGASAVLQRTARDTTLRSLSPAQRAPSSLPGKNWSFDALRGDKLFLINQLRDGYQVRLFDLAANRLRRRRSRIRTSRRRSGARRSRASPRPTAATSSRSTSASNGGAMVHVLDLAKATARCIDLAGDGRLRRGDDVCARRLARRPHALGGQPRLRAGRRDRRAGAPGRGRVPIRPGTGAAARRHGARSRPTASGSPSPRPSTSGSSTRRRAR